MVSVLSLVRDAVARLPDGVGTRTDVVELCKESQWFMDNGTVDENTISMTIGGGLDRLSAEEDPNVRFDGITRLWVNLHAKRKVNDYTLNFSRKDQINNAESGLAHRAGDNYAAQM